jgi:mannonate dehydratase
MKLGLGLYKHQLNKRHFRFARQAGCTHVVAHLVDYFAKGDVMPDMTQRQSWGVTTNQNQLWTTEMLRDLRRSINDEGLELEAIENFDPSHWHDILLDGPNRERQLEDIKAIIRRVGEAGIRIIGYNFSLAGVWGHVRGRYSRGGAESVGFRAADIQIDDPIPNGAVWNMVYDPHAPAGTVAPCSTEELWQRVDGFLQEVLPVAEEAGVVLAAHPDDPPVEFLRGQPRLVNQPGLYQRLIDLAPSRANQLEFCLGSLQEMTQGNVYDAIEQYGRQGRIAYVHFRNVRGKVPDYREVFVDEGDIDMFRALRGLRAVGFEGVLIPDHTPHLDCDAGWHAGMAYALGYMRAAITAVESES